MSTVSTTLRMDLATRVTVWIACGVLGTGLGLILPWLLRHASTWPIPFIDYLKFLGSFDTPAMVFGRPALLALVGLVVAFLITHESPELTISAEEILIKEGDDTRRILRDAVSGVYRRDGKIRIESATGRVLFEGAVEGRKLVVAAAFRAHGYPWEGADVSEQLNTSDHS